MYVQIDEEEEEEKARREKESERERERCTNIFCIIARLYAIRDVCIFNFTNSYFYAFVVRRLYLRTALKWP